MGDRTLTAWVQYQIQIRNHRHSKLAGLSEEDPDGRKDTYGLITVPKKKKKIRTQ